MKNENPCWNTESAEYCISEWNGVLTKHYFDERPDEIIQLALN